MQTVKLVPKEQLVAEIVPLTLFLSSMPFINLVDDEIVIKGKQYIFSTLELSGSSEDLVSKDFELSITKGLQIKNAVNFLMDSNIDLPTYNGIAGKRYALNGQTNKTENGVYVPDGSNKLIKYSSSAYFDQYEKGSLFKITEGAFAGRFFFAPTTKKFNNNSLDEAFDFIEIKESQLDISILNHFDDAFDKDVTIFQTSDSVLAPRPNSIPSPFIIEMETNFSRKLRTNITEADGTVALIANISGSDVNHLFINIESAAGNIGKGINIQIRNKVKTSFLKNLMQARLIQGLNSSTPY